MCNSAQFINFLQKKKKKVSNIRENSDKKQLDGHLLLVLYFISLNEDHFRGFFLLFFFLTLKLFTLTQSDAGRRSHALVASQEQFIFDHQILLLVNEKYQGLKPAAAVQPAYVNVFQYQFIQERCMQMCQIQKGSQLYTFSPNERISLYIQPSLEPRVFELLERLVYEKCFKFIKEFIFLTQKPPDL